MRDTGKESHSHWPSFPRPSFSPVAQASSNPNSLPSFLLLLFHTLPLGSLFGVPSSWALHQGPLKGHRASSQLLILADFSCADLSSVTWENQREQRPGQQGMEEGIWLVAYGDTEKLFILLELWKGKRRETLGSGKGRISGTPLPQPLQVKV